MSTEHDYGVAGKTAESRPVGSNSEVELEI